MGKRQFRLETHLLLIALGIIRIKTGGVSSQKFALSIIKPFLSDKMSNLIMNEKRQELKIDGGSAQYWRHEMLCST